jgi:predicted O-linked N-acetylglucosamine transferase (SPINDLY family)
MPPIYSDNPKPATMADLSSARLTELFERARALHQQGQLEPARATYEEILAMQPGHFETLNLLGVLSGQSRDLQRAVEYFDKALAVQPDSAASHCNRGLALQQLRQLDEALMSFDRAIALKNDDAVAFYSRGNVFKDLGQLERALADYDKAVTINHGFAQAYFHRGLVLQQIQDLDAALSNYDRAIENKADFAEAHANRGLVLYHLKQFEAALASYDQAIAVSPDHAPAYLHRGNALKALHRFDLALASYQQAVELEPDYAEAYLNRGAVLYDLNRIDEALESYDQAIAAKPDYADAYFNRASLLREIKQFEAAASDYKVAADLDPDIKFVAGARLEVRMQVCDFSDFDADVGRVAASIERGEPASHPFAFLTFSDSPRLQKLAAQIWVREMCPPDPSLGPIPKRTPHEKIRIGYFSADFREHPVSRLLAELIEMHDRSRFEVIAFSFGPDTRGDLRKRLERAFDRFLDLKDSSDMEIASVARSLAIDIAVDLGGYTHHSRPNVFALRAAPIQISYLGYLGTMGAPYMDYLVADAATIPRDEHQHYSERIIYLPSYQVNDSRRRIAERTFTRRELGIPPTGFVFSCFNSNYKITRATLAVWMRILRRVEDGILFLTADNELAKRNLLNETRRLGVDSHRIVFGERLGVEDYLARFRTMDLFLDTLPYNAGTTASDALWTGLPVLTCTGASFAGRVATSALRAIDLPELITETPAQYEELAVALASSPSRLAQIKTKLAANRLTRPLFNSRLFAKHLETAYTNIYERHQSDLPPDHIYVESH